MLLSEHGVRAAALALLAASACGDDGSAPLSCPVGDRTQPIELAIMVSDGTTLRDFVDGEMVPLRRPLQGGQAVMIALPAKDTPNMADDPQLRELTLDPKHRRVLSTDGRSAVGAAAVNTCA